MLFINKILLKLISFGIYPQMEDNKKIAIHITSFDGVASCLVFFFYSLYHIHGKNSLISYSHFIAFILSGLGIYLIKRKMYDAGRILIHTVGLLVIFITIDGFAPRSGLEFYYFSPMIVPFAIFTPEELNKSILLALSGFIFFVIQQVVGPGHLSNIIHISETDRVLSIAILFMYIIGLFIISRWQMKKAYEKTKTQQS